MKKDNLSLPGDGYHESVMVSEVIEALHISKQLRYLKKLGKYIDATTGTGGHAIEILESGGSLLGIDLDPEMLKTAKKRFEELKACPFFKLVQSNFTNIDVIAKENGFETVSGIILDLGVSNIHLTSEIRGFSFNNPKSALDMRIDPSTQGVTGSDLLNVLRQDQLINLFGVTLDYGSTRWLTKQVLAKREESLIKTVGDFLELTSGLRVKPSLNSATLPFLALRIAVNSELTNLKEVLPKAYGLLEKGGKLAVISFHSGEDEIVKKFINTEPIFPTSEEILRNPRSRSAKLRVIEKT